MQIIGPGNLNNIVRLQLAYMPPEISSIKVHRDMGGYALKAHRIHIPVFSNPKVTFEASGKGGSVNSMHRPGPLEPY